MATAMNETLKVVVSTTLDRVDWQNSALLEGDLAEAVHGAQSVFFAILILTLVV